MITLNSYEQERNHSNYIYMKFLKGKSRSYDLYKVILSFSSSGFIIFYRILSRYLENILGVIKYIKLLFSLLEALQISFKKEIELNSVYRILIRRINYGTLKVLNYLHTFYNLLYTNMLIGRILNIQ